MARWYVRARLRAEMRPLWVAALRARRAALAGAPPTRGTIPPPARAVIPFDTADGDLADVREVVTAESAAVPSGASAAEGSDGVVPGEDAPPPPHQPWSRAAPGLVVRELPSPPPRANQFSARADSRSPSNMIV
jgi:hypothetical protein